MNQYTELYKSLSNSDLLKIINNPNDYHLSAIEAAKSELADRQLTEVELESANAENEIQESKKQAQIEKKQALKNNFRSTISSIGNTINPIQKEPLTKNKIIIIIGLVFSLMFLVQVFSLWGLIKFMFTNKSAIWDLSMVIYFLILISLPLGTVLFGFRKKIGWVVLSVYIGYSACYSIILFSELIFIHHPENPFITNLFPPISPLPILLKTLFFGGMLWAMCRDEIRSDYHIDKKTLFITTGFATCLTVVLFFSHLLV